MLDEVARELGASEHDYSDPIDSHILRGVCLTLPILQSRDDMQVHIRTRNGVCALVTWFSRLLGFVVEVTRRQGDDKDCQPSVVRLGTTDRRVCVKIDTVSEEYPCIMLKGLRQLTKVTDRALLAEKGGTYMGNLYMRRMGRLQNEHRVDQDGKIFQYEAIKTFLRTDFNFWLDKKVHGVTRRPVKGLGKTMLERAATTFAGEAGSEDVAEEAGSENVAGEAESEDDEDWVYGLRTVTILFALDVAVHLRKCSFRSLPDKSVTANDIHPRVNDRPNNNEGHMSLIPHWHVFDAARLIFDDDQILAGSYDKTYQIAVDTHST